MRKLLDDMGRVACIPSHLNQLRNVVANGGFDYRGEHFVCPEGKVLRASAHLKQDRKHQYFARQHDCQRSPRKSECLPLGLMQRYVAPGIYHSLHLEAKMDIGLPSLSLGALINC